MERREKYGMHDTPNFEDGEIVEFDTSIWGYGEASAQYIEGMVAGKFIDSVGKTSWIIDFGDKEWFPGIGYRSMVIEKHCIVKRETDLVDNFNR